jgi:hypothetical protein
LFLCLLSECFPKGFLTKIVYAFLVSPILVTFPACHSVLITRD